MPDSTRRPLKVFLCHASADKLAVRRLYRYLRSKRMDPWLDAEKLLPGEHWEVEIPKALFASDVILVCLSRNSINKEGYVQKEIAFALDKAMEKPDGTIFIVPAKLEECDVPGRLTRYHWVDLYRDDGRKRLMLSLNKRAEQLGPSVEQAVVTDNTLEREKLEREAREKIAREKAERDAAEKSALERAEREAFEKSERERLEQEARESEERERAQRDANAKVAREKAEREAFEKSELERLAKETQERLAREKAERENKARIARANEEREKATREAQDRAARQKAEQETREQVTRESAEREKLERDTRDKARRERKIPPVLSESVVDKSNPKKQVIKKIPLWGIGLITLTVLALANWVIFPSLMSPKPTRTPFATRTVFAESGPETSVSITDTATARPSATRTPASATYTPRPTRTSAPSTPALGSTILSDKDGMTLLYVPAGEFVMGSNTGTVPADEYHKPEHSVYLDAFWIDKTEVTNAMYAKCVQDGQCDPPFHISSSTRDRYYGNPEFDNYPVIWVTWDTANKYCEWAGRRLPTEAEWEKAARGENAFIYPWGNEELDSSRLNNSSDDTTEVGKYPLGASPYGALDMAGNVSEWVADWYSETYYQNSVSTNPLGPSSGIERVKRGGTYATGSSFYLTYNRAGIDPGGAAPYYGIRCAMSANP